MKESKYYTNGNLLLEIKGVPQGHAIVYQAAVRVMGPLTLTEWRDVQPNEVEVTFS